MAAETARVKLLGGLAVRSGGGRSIRRSPGWF